MWFPQAHILPPVQVVYPVHSSEISPSSSHGSGLVNSFAAFLHSLQSHNCLTPYVVRVNVVRVLEDNSRQGLRRNWRIGCNREERQGDTAGAPEDQWSDAAVTKKLPPWKAGTDESFTGELFDEQPSWKARGESHSKGHSEVSISKPNLELNLSSFEQGTDMDENEPPDSFLENAAKFSLGITSSPKSRRNTIFRRAPWQQGFRNSGQTRSLEEGERRQEEENMSDDVEIKYFDACEQESAMHLTVEKLHSIEVTEENPEKIKEVELQQRSLRLTPGSIFLPKRGQDHFCNSKNSRTPDHPDLEPVKSILLTRFPRELDEEADPQEKIQKQERAKHPTSAELKIPQSELKRLRMLSIQLKPRLKVGRLGVTENIAQSIRERWRICELVKVKCEGPSLLDMKKIHKDLESITGGLVVWRAGSVAVIYRGKHYDQLAAERETCPSVAKPDNAIFSEKHEVDFKRTGGNNIGSQQNPEKDSEISGQEDNGEGSLAFNGSKPTETIVDRDIDLEIESILKDLGPRYEDWTGEKPAPVDGDLLPATVPGYKPPFRLLPYRVKPTLGNTELTNLRRLSRSLSPHFVLGRNKGLQGLAVAMVKLWEKREVAKIAVKRRVQNTNNERMAEELKLLTGGVLISRNKYFITLYRGKDFLPKSVVTALLEREALVRTLHEEEESARAEASIPVLVDSELKSNTAGTFPVRLEPKATWQLRMDLEEQCKLKLEAAKARQLEEVQRIERRLAVALAKKAKAEKGLEKVEHFLRPSMPPADHEMITEEERFMFRKLGLRMDAFLLLGRRGVFDGVVENMHLHWKHRELVKVILKERDCVHVQETARMLEYESGGILVATVPTSKGQAIIMYRGKNYQRPAQLRPRNLLTKRKALKRSLELQRHESLAKHVLALEKEITKLKAGLSNYEDNAIKFDSEKATGRTVSMVGATEIEETVPMPEDVKDRVSLVVCHLYRAKLQSNKRGRIQRHHILRWERRCIQRSCNCHLRIL
eukprot:c28389_g1_i1 orf=405-3392(-)